MTDNNSLTINDTKAPDLYDRIIEAKFLKPFSPLLKKHKEFALYTFYGIFTAAINYVVYSLLIAVEMNVLIANAIAWILSVLYAFITNRKFVFKAAYQKSFFTELIEFFTGRFITLLIEEAMLYYLVEKLCYNKFIIKLIALAIVIALNYVFSKFIVFKRKK